MRAGISAHIHPHLLRHAFADHIARHAGIRNAQFLLGHADIATTEIYLGQPTLDDLAGAVEGFVFGTDERTDVLGVPRCTRSGQQGDDRNRTGVHGFAGRCVTTPPRRQGSPLSVAAGAVAAARRAGARCYDARSSRAISSAGRAPARQAGGHWFEPSIAHSEAPVTTGVSCFLGAPWYFDSCLRNDSRRPVARLGQ